MYFLKKATLLRDNLHKSHPSQVYSSVGSDKCIHPGNHWISEVTGHCHHPKTFVPFAVNPTSGPRLSVLPGSELHVVSWVWLSPFSVTPPSPSMLWATAVCFSCRDALGCQLTIQNANQRVFPSSILPGAIDLLADRPSQRDSCPLSQVEGTQVLWLCSHSVVRKGSLHIPTAWSFWALASLLQHQP